MKNHFALLLLLALLLPLTAATSCSNGSPPALISVRGEGTVNVAPDMATITLGISSEAVSARKALSRNNEGMERILAEMKNAGIDDKDLQTSGFQLHPNYNYNKKTSPPSIMSYTASNQLTIRIRNMEAIGKILDRAVSLGVNHAMNNIQFSNSDPSRMLKEARKAAVRDAKEKAETIVSELGVCLGAIHSISEGTSGAAAVGMRAQSASMALIESSSVPIAGGETSYRVGVEISWRIHEGKNPNPSA